MPKAKRKKLWLSVALSTVSVMSGLLPFYCMYRMICLFADGGITTGAAVLWCLLALAAYAVKILTFSLSTGISHSMAYTILEGLRLRLCRPLSSRSLRQHAKSHHRRNQNRHGG